MESELIAQVAGGVLAVMGAVAARRRITPALPEHGESVPRVQCTCTEDAIARAVTAAIDPERIKVLVRQALHDHVEQASRSHDKLDRLDDLTLLVGTLNERMTSVLHGVEALRTHSTPPLGLKR